VASHYFYERDVTSRLPSSPLQQMSAPAYQKWMVDFV